MDRKIADASLLAHVPDHVGPRKMAFRGGAVHWRQPPGSRSLLGTGHSTVIMLAPSEGVSLGFEGERSRRSDVTSGMLAIRPANVEWKASWDGATECIVVGHSAESILELAGHEFGRVDVELRPTHMTLDRAASEFAKMIRRELNHLDNSNELYLDSLITLLGIHVLRNYSSARKPAKPPKTGLTPAVASRVRDYLHEHFLRKLTTAELAAICGLSVGHFTQAFSKTFGWPPYRYVLERRLDFAERLLSETTMPVAEVAFLSGFSSQSHLSNLMRTSRNKTPNQLREKTHG
ncbi:helix-turn-helix transcriptional regulator [Rhizobiaceae bacterium LC148]|nr:AraC family transcriptional regulator [Rhizobium sp. LC145]TKT46596.1 helix-turn-helix transcriptional regulator [Rhizobiaceae bacterium LC148]